MIWLFMAILGVGKPFYIAGLQSIEPRAQYNFRSGQPPPTLETTGMHALVSVVLVDADHNIVIPTPLLTQTLDRVLQALQDPQRPWGHLVSFNIVRILNVLDQRNDIDAAAIAHYEWAYLPLLRHERQLSLHEHLATGPDLFAQMIASVYRPAKEEAPIESTMEDVARARQAYDLLSSWRRIPGTQPDGNIDEHQLFGWVDNARAACETRSDMCDSHIGRVLAYAPKGTDGVWPHEAVRALIEHVNSAALGGGFRAGIFNTRGFFTRDPFAGGTQERDLATQYRGWAQKLAAVAPHRRRAL